MIFPILFLLKIVLNIWGPLWLSVNFRRPISFIVSEVQRHSTSSMTAQVWDLLMVAVMKMYVETVTTFLHREPEIWMGPGFLQNPSLRDYYEAYEIYTNIFCGKHCSACWSFLEKNPGKLLTKKTCFLLWDMKKFVYITLFVCLGLL